MARKAQGVRITFPARPRAASVRRMKSSFRRTSVALGWLGFLLPVEAWSQADDFEIAGASVSSSVTEVMLIQKSTGDGRWVKIGQSFAGYTAKSYDAKTGQLTLTKDQSTHVLTLKKATVQTAGATMTPPRPEEQKSITNNLRQLAAASDQYFLEQGVSTVNSSQLIGPEPNKYIKEMKPVAGETYLGITIEQGKPIRVKTAGGFEMEYKN